MCICNPSIKTPVCKDCPEDTNSSRIPSETKESDSKLDKSKYIVTAKAIREAKEYVRKLLE